jgi:hypothetical protein
MTRSLSATLLEIPLHLLPRAVAQLIREKGYAVYRISIKRTHWHHFNVSVRTKRIKRELAPVTVAVIGAVADLKAKRARAGRSAA